MVMVSGGGGNAWAKEMTLRRRIASIFNKTQEHFPTLKDYNDYLEEVEDMTFNLIEGIDVEEIEAKIARYQQENAEQIYLSRAKRAEDLAAALKASRMNPVKAEANDTAAGSSQGISGGAGVQGQYAPAAVLGGVAQPRPTGMAPQLIGSGSDPLQGDDEETRRLRAERAARAGGWTAELSKRRALEEAFSAIFI
ncbi:RNA polymerase II transcription factor B subunit 3 [Zea mays]|uniref:CDK-activating kinase assembly factor MAT1 family protein n=1 Tax=Zea mays TaxID=4577 RepID=B6TUE1_MAIZE|nr:CDK-activating kinase assembly factor MAT1 family protein [Zea mays]XP_008659242.1 RNA polymerase II transcription factor B subunit 3 [Zea mays]ACG40724.1 CDK-activating kinase assembly factor MAT1 family protein [Zea mays]AQL01740.1 CDK-activating kinase assembly factor MAT1 family protein [Zea mays]|eukprot:NP_001150873.1 CDK-activating kinase assembly factor MAT1 family protein [Zea mays]